VECLNFFHGEILLPINRDQNDISDLRNTHANLITCESIFKGTNQISIRILVKYLSRKEKLNEVTLVLFTLLFFVVACSDNKTQTSNNLNWTSDLRKAIETAKAENKAVLVNFTGSD